MQENKNRFHDEYGNEMIAGAFNEPCVPGDSTRIMVCESRSQEDVLASIRQESSFPRTYSMPLMIGECSVSDIWAAPGIVEIRLRCGK